MSPSPRLVVAVGLAVLAALVMPGAIALLILLALGAAAAVDAVAARRAPLVERQLDTILSRGVGGKLVVARADDDSRPIHVRQPSVPEIVLTPAEGPGGLDSTMTPTHRGRFTLPPLAVRTTGPLGLSRWDRKIGEPAEVLVYPDLPSARRLAMRVRTGRSRDEGSRTRGPLGLGTEFEYVRDYSPDDDVRQINWRATARLERAMSNQYRADRDRDVICLVDSGRLMAAPVDERTTRLDASLDAVTAVALVADVLGDRCGTLAFDAAVRRDLAPRRSGGTAVIKALFDLESSTVDSDYEYAFRRVGGSKRAFVLVFTDLVDEAAARSLVSAVPVLARRHAVAIATIRDPDLEGLLSTPPTRPLDAYAASVAVGVLEARTRVVASLQRSGALVVEALPSHLPEACVNAYVRSKARALV